MKKGYNRRKSLRRLKPTVGCNASKRRRRRSSDHIFNTYILIISQSRDIRNTLTKREHQEMHYDKQDVLRNFKGLCYVWHHNNLQQDSVVSFQAVATGGSSVDRSTGLFRWVD